MKTLLKKSKQSSSSDRLIYLKVLIYLSITKVLIKLLEFDTIKSVFSWLFQLPTTTNPNLEKIVKNVNLVASKYPKYFTCLPNALVTKFFFRNDSSVNIIIGISLNAGVLVAHAWVRKDDEIIIGRDEVDYQKIWTWC